MRRWGQLLLFVLGWSLAHNLAVAMYIQLCAPMTPLGILTSPLLMGTPHCTALRWVIQQGPMKIDATWIVVASMLCAAAPAWGTVALGGALSSSSST